MKLDEQKAICRQLQGARLGGYVDGVDGRMGASGERDRDLLGLSCYMLARSTVKKIHLQILMGLWAFVLQYRREFFAYTDAIWLLIVQCPGKGRIEWTEAARMEIITLMMALPGMTINLRRSICPLVTCSDASEYGGGVCVAKQLTLEGEKALLRMGLSSTGAARGTWGLIEMFAGIGGGRRAFELIKVEVAVHAACEIKPEAVSILRAQYPQCLQWGDARGVGVEHLLNFMNVGTRVTKVLIVSGSP